MKKAASERFEDDDEEDLDDYSVAGPDQENSIGSKVKALRVHSNYSQEQLSEKSGVDRGSISKYEKGIRSPRFSALEKIAKACNIHASYFTYNFTPAEYHLRMNDINVVDEINELQPELQRIARAVVSTIYRESFNNDRLKKHNIK